MPCGRIFWFKHFAWNPRRSPWSDAEWPALSASRSFDPLWAHKLKQQLAFAGVGLWACKEASGQCRSFWHWRRQKFRCSNWQPLSQRERCVSRGPSLPRVGSWRYKKCRPCYCDLNSTWQVSWEVVVYDTKRCTKPNPKAHCTLWYIMRQRLSTSCHTPKHIFSVLFWKVCHWSDSPSPRVTVALAPPGTAAPGHVTFDKERNLQVGPTVTVMKEQNYWALWRRHITNGRFMPGPCSVLQSCEVATPPATQRFERQGMKGWQAGVGKLRQQKIYQARVAGTNIKTLVQLSVH